MVKRFILLSLLTLFFLSNEARCQSKLELRDYFYDAESWILFEDYKEALPLYQILLKTNPANANYKYRVGQCYLNTPGEKEKAVSYLEDAVRDINPKYREGRYRETKAPYDALYYLANAYRINNQIDKAIDTYRQFRKNLDSEVYDSNIVNLQIQSCLNARDLMARPLFIRQTNLSNTINENTSEFSPVVSDKEDMLVFARSEAFYDAIMYSVKNNGKWTGPVNLNEIFRVDKDLFPTSLSNDGKTLYLYSSADYDGIIYTSTYINGSWSPLTRLNDNINTKYWESHATVSHDDKKLYFTSNRKGSIGGLDIYVSYRDSVGDWGPAFNLGPVINTPYNEESPFLSRDDKTLFFSSRGHYNMGGYDIFYSTLLSDGRMSVPLNAGYPLNSTDDDVFFKPINEGYEGYYAKESTGGYGKQDIYRIEIFSNEHPRKFLVRGIVKVADLVSNLNDSVKVLAVNTGNTEKTYVVYSNPKTGEYEFELPHGNYEITYQGEKSEKITRNVELPLSNNSDSFVLPGTILPRTDFVADLNVGRSQTINVHKGDTVLFPLRVEPGSLLTIERWMGDSLLSTETFNVTDSIFNYKLVPGQGDNRIAFKLTDRFSNITTADVFITLEKSAAEQTLVRPEYSRIIARKQISAFTAMLKSRGNDNIRKIIGDAAVEKQRFGKIDDLISYLKEEGIKKNIDPEEVDKLALNVAVRDNVLTQAAVDYMAKHTSDTELKKILEDLNIYNENLKTWTDLQKFINEKTNGRISPEELNRIASDILTDADPSIAVLRDKILAYSKYSEAGAVIRESVATVDLDNIKSRGKWLEAFRNESERQGLSRNQFFEMMASIGNLPGTSAEQFLKDLIANAEEPLLSALKTIDLRKENIKTPEDLIAFLLNAKDKEMFPEDEIYRAFAGTIASKNIPENQIALQVAEGKKFPWWILIIAGAAAFSVFVLLRERGSSKDKSK